MRKTFYTKKKLSEMGLEPGPKWAKFIFFNSLLHKNLDKKFWKKNLYSWRGKKGWIFWWKLIVNISEKLLYQWQTQTITNSQKVSMMNLLTLLELLPILNYYKFCYSTQFLNMSWWLNGLELQKLPLANKVMWVWVPVPSKFFFLMKIF